MENRKPMTRNTKFMLCSRSQTAEVVLPSTKSVVLVKIHNKYILYKYLLYLYNMLNIVEYCILCWSHFKS